MAASEEQVALNRKMEEISRETQKKVSFSTPRLSPRLIYHVS
jgi:hypothetical protein